MLDAGEYSSSSSAECLMMSCFNNNNNDNSTRSSTSTSRCIKKRRKTKYTRRFSDDQIKSLETIFGTETKLEPKMKLQLARELGLQPRQVAIWFQNKRARWKSKQLERDYNLLKSNYDHLAFQFDSLKNERQTLLDQLQKLNDLINKSEAKEAEHGAPARGAPADIIVGELVNDDNKMIKSSTSAGGQYDVKKASPFFDLERTEFRALNSDDDESTRNPDSYLGLEEEAAAELPLNIPDPANSSNMTEPKEWGTLESDDLLDQPSNGCKWWDFWS